MLQEISQPICAVCCHPRAFGSCPRVCAEHQMEQDIAPDSRVQVYSDGCYHGQSGKLSDATFTICKSYIATIQHPETDDCRTCALILLLPLAAIFDILLFVVGVAMWPLNLLISTLCFMIGTCCPSTQCQDAVGCCDVTACCVSGAWLFLLRGC